MPPSPSPEDSFSSTASPPTSHDFASHIEEGRSPVTSPWSSPQDDSSSPQHASFDEKAATVAASPSLKLKRSPKSRTSTFAAATTRSARSTLQRALSWSTSVGAAILPNTSSSNAPTFVPKLEDYPLGYPRLSYVLDSDDSFMMYRRFGQLHSRLLLHKQDQLREMEEELLALDRRDDRMEDTQLFLKSRAEDEERDPPARGRSRTELLARIETTLAEYSKLLLQAKEMQALNRPTDRDHASVSNYFANDQPVLEQDREWIARKEDLVTIRAGREHAWLDAAVEGALRWYPCRPVKVR